MKFLTFSVVLLLLLNAASLFFLFRAHLARTNDRPGRGEGPANYIMQQLKLDDNQQKQFEALRSRHQDSARRFRDEDRKLHDIYFSLLKTDHPDNAKVDSVAFLIGASRKVLEKLTFDHFRQVRIICRDDQKKLFDATIDEIARMMAKPVGPPPH